MDIATLFVEVRSDPVEVATDRLDKFTGAANRAENAAGGMSSGATEAARKIVAANDDVATSADKATTSMSATETAAKRMAGAWGPLAVAGAVAIAAVGAALLGMQYEINKTSDVSVSLKDVLIGNFEVIKSGIKSAASAIGEFFKPAIDLIAPWFAAAWDAVIGRFKSFNNMLIGGWKTAFDAIKIIWNSLPSVVGDLAYSTANRVIAAIEGMVNAAIQRINQVIEYANKIPGVDISKFGEIEMGRLQNPDAGAAADMAAQIAAAASGNLATDWLGRYFEAAKKAAIANAELSKSTEDAGKAAAGAKNNFQSLTESILNHIQAAQTEAAVFGLTAGQAASTAAALDLLRAAKESNLPIDAALIEQINSLSEAYANATLKVQGMRLEAEMRTPYEELVFQLANLDEMLAAGVISWETYTRAVADARSTINDVYRDSLSAMGSALSSISQIMEREGGKQLATSKAFGVAAAIVNTAVGITKAFELPFPLNFAVAASVAAAGAAQIHAITSANKGGGGSRSSVPSSVGAGRSQPQQAPQSAPQQAIHIEIRGETFSRQAVMDLMDQMSDIAGDGHKLIIKAA